MSLTQQLDTTPDERIDKSNLATQLMENMLLEQYANSPNLKAYLNIFMKELNLLFQASDDAYFGRFVVNAVGYQLDVIGEILQQSRNMVLTEDPYFGFQGFTGVDGMANETTPLDGGIFKDGDISKYEVSPLGDDMYRRLLLARGMVVSLDVMDVNSLYAVLYVLLPNATDIHIVEHPDYVEVQLQDTQVSNLELSMLIVIRTWLIQAGERLVFTAS